MGLFSKLKKGAETLSKAQNYHESGKENVSKNVVDFGEPAYTLYTALKLGDLHQKINITDENDKVKYYTKSSVFTLKGKTDIMDASGNVIAHLEKKPISLHEKHFVTMADGTSFTMSNELFHIVKDVTNIEGLGWQLRGNFVGLNFNLMDQAGNPIATVGKKIVSIHDKFCIDLYRPEYEKIVVAIVIQLEKMLEARRENEEESSSSFSFGFGDDN